MYPNPYTSHEKVKRIVRRRRFLRRARLITLILGALVLIPAASYGVVRGILFAQHVWDEHHRHLASRSATTAPTATTPTMAGPPPCATSQVSAYLSHWEITGGTLYETIVMDDTAGTACSTVLGPGQTSSGAPGQCYEGQSLGVIVPKATTALSVPQPLSFTFGTAGFDTGPFGAGSPPNPPPTSE